MSDIKVSVLGSGSKGNCTLIETPQTKILIDCGFSTRETVKRLTGLGVNPSEINAIFLTHENKDHTDGVAGFARKFDVPVFANEISLGELEGATDVSGVNFKCFSNEDFYFRELTVAPFEVSHDSKHCNGYSIYSAGEKVSLTTDLGYIDEKILLSLEGSHTVVIESNHEPSYLMANTKYPVVLKQRIAGKCGHLSNEDCAEAIVSLAKTGTKNFVLAHLSQENNTPQKALQITSDELLNNGADIENEFNILVASQTQFVKANK